MTRPAVDNQVALISARVMQHVGVKLPMACGPKVSAPISSSSM